MATVITLDRKSPVIIIDTSYFIFYRYFSSIKWYQFKNKEIDFADIHNDEVFMKALEKHTLADLTKLCKKWKTTLANIVFCYDCCRDTIWRNEFTDGYKAGRIVNPKFNANVFTHFYEYIEKNKDEWQCSIVSIPKLEADDVAYLSKQHIQANKWTEKIVIITNDNDYLQTLDDQTYIYNMNGKGNDISLRSCGDPVLDLKLKLIMGDKSDNIKPIHYGINKTTAIDIASLDEKYLNLYLDEKKCKDVYYNNRILIDFSMIPEEYIKEFNDKYVWQFE